MPARFPPRRSTICNRKGEPYDPPDDEKDPSLPLRVHARGHRGAGRLSGSPDHAGRPVRRGRRHGHPGPSAGGDDGKEAWTAHRRAERFRRGRHARGGAGGRRQTGRLHARLCAHRDHVFAAACDEASLRDGCVRLHRHVRQPARGSDDRQKRPVEEHQRIYRNGEKEPQQVRRGHHRDRQHDPCAHAAVCRALRLEAAFHPLPQRRGDF